MDNTLILFDEDKFLLEYAQLAAPYFSDVIDPHSFFRKLLASTQHMLKNDGAMTNVEAFTHHFLADSPSLNYEECYTRFDQFYQEAFPKLNALVKPATEGRALLIRALKAGLQVVIATNPIFPERATKHRLEWANVADLAITLVTDAENMRYCKPRPEYYRTILDILGKHPHECLMAGNDPVSDMSASAIGIKTYLVENQEEIARLGMVSTQIGKEAQAGGGETRFKTDWQGKLKDVADVLFSD
jgi:FMN phosphatase YigB (HAD superfamily)